MAQGDETSMSNAKRSAALQGIEVRTDSKGRKRYRGTARDKNIGKHLRGPWTGSLAEARSWRVDAQARLQAGTLSAATGPTLAEAAAEFIAQLKSGTFRQRSGHTYKPSLIRGYERDLKNHAVPMFGTKRLARLQRPELQRWVDELTAGDRSPSTVRNIVATLRALIGFGELRGWVHHNPCTGLRMPSGEKVRDRIASPGEAARLIAALRPKDQAALGLAVYAGLRLGELLSLEVSDVDLEGGWIHVRRSWDKGVKDFVPTKSRKERRVPIIDRLATLLRDHFILLDHPAKGLVFPSHKRPEWPIDPGILRRQAKTAWETAGLTPLGFHEGRHTFASIGIAAGLNAKTLSTYLGHATITITLDRYGHLMPGSEVEARAMLDVYLNCSEN
jgi:integrase